MKWFFPVLLLSFLASAEKHHHCKMVTGEERVCKMVLQPSQKEGCSPVCSLQPLEQCRMVEKEECSTEHGTKCGKELADSIFVTQARSKRSISSSSSGHHLHHLHHLCHHYDKAIEHFSHKKHFILAKLLHHHCHPLALAGLAGLGGLAGAVGLGVVPGGLPVVAGLLKLKLLAKHKLHKLHKLHLLHNALPSLNPLFGGGVAALGVGGVDNSEETCFILPRTVCPVGSSGAACSTSTQTVCGVSPSRRRRSLEEEGCHVVPVAQNCVKKEAVRECKTEESRVCEPLAASCQEEVEVCAVEKVQREVCH